MRAFLTACAVILLLAVGTMAVLDLFVQRPVAVAFATTGARV